MKGQPNVVLSPVITANLNSPMHISHAGDGSHRLFICEKAGLIKVYNKSYTLIDTFITMSGLGTGGEEGLLSLCFHPNYITNGHCYVNYVNAANGNIEIARYTRSSTNANELDPTSKLLIISIPHPNTNHNGGEMHFGKDGYLYLSIGDGGGAGDPSNYAQNTGVLLGKILRLNVDATSGTNNYSIPSGNPFSNEVFVYGLRNPFRWSFDRYTGDMYIGDVGQSAKEEIDYLKSGNIAGKNLGWRCYEGNSAYITTGCSSISNYTFPVHDYVYSSTSKSIIGGVLYRGYKYPDLKRYYVASDYYSTSKKLMKYDSLTTNWVVTNQAGGQSSISDYGESEDGELYAVKYTGTVYQLTHTNSKTVYTFSGSGDWMTATNWKDGAVPPNPLPAGSVIVIKPLFGGNCILNANRTLSIGADLFVEAGAEFVVNSYLKID